MLTEIHAATLCVANLERSSRFYREAFGFAVVGEGDVCATLLEAWRAPAGCTGRSALLGPQGAASGFLRLIELDRPGRSIWGDYPSIPDHGLFALNFRVEAHDAVWMRLMALGAKVRAPVTRYALAGMDVIDGQVFDPDGVVIDVHALSGELGALEEARRWDCSPVSSVAIHAGPVDTAIAFYRALGFEVLYDKTLDDLGPFLGYPEGLVLRNANLLKRGRSPHGRIELSDYVGKPAGTVTAHAHPPNLGLTLLSFASDDLAGDRAMLAALGAEPGRFVDAVLEGRTRRSITFSGPVGEMLEIFEDTSP